MDQFFGPDSWYMNHKLNGAYARRAPNGGKLAGLDVGTKTIGLAICDAGWHFAGPADTIRRIAAELAHVAFEQTIELPVA